MANQELRERSDHKEISVLQGNWSPHMQHDHPTVAVRNGEIKVRVRPILRIVQSIMIDHLRACRECSTSPKFSCSHSRICRAGKRWRCRSPSYYLDSTPILTLIFLRNLQATLINGGPRALVWGILIVVAGALAQAASLAEMASAQPIAGAQYVCHSKASTRVQLTTRRSTGLTHLHRLVNVASLPGCKVG